MVNRELTLTNKKTHVLTQLQNFAKEFQLTLVPQDHNVRDSFHLLDSNNRST